jgi:hypothetical protein
VFLLTAGLRATAAAVVVFGLTLGAHANSVQTVTTLTLVDTHFSDTYAPIQGHGPTIKDDLKTSYPFTNPLTGLNFFTASPAASSGLACSSNKNSSNYCGKADNDLVSGVIDITLQLTLEDVTKRGDKTISTTILGTGTLTATGTYYANYNGTLGCSQSTGKQTDCVVWSGEKN